MTRLFTEEEIENRWKQQTPRLFTPEEIAARSKTYTYPGNAEPVVGVTGSAAARPTSGGQAMLSAARERFLTGKQKNENSPSASQGTPQTGGAANNAKALGWDVATGLTNVGNSIWKAIDFLLPDEYIMGGDNPLTRFIDNAVQSNDTLQELENESDKKADPAAQFIGDNLVQPLASSIPNAVVSYMSGGLSMAPALANTASGTGAAITTTLQGMTKNPSFWMSAIPTFGSTYDDAISDGASELEATATAFLNAFAGSAIEIGGGIETIPKSAPAIRTWVKGMLDEGKEEVLQGIVENLSEKALYDQDKEWISADNPDAVLNPSRMLQEAAGGMAAGGILGGAQMAAGQIAGRWNNRGQDSASGNAPGARGQSNNALSLEYTAPHSTNGMQYSIQANPDGSRYVRVDTDQDIFEGKTVKEMRETARKYILDKFRGKVIPLGEDSNAFVNGRAASEYANPANRRMPEDLKAAKMKAAPELDNLLAVSRRIAHTPDDGRHPDATGGWDTYLTNFQIGDEYFTGEVKIKITDRGRLFYDVTQIERTTRNRDQTGVNPAAASGSSFNPSVSQNTDGVNTSISGSTGKDTRKYADYVRNTKGHPATPNAATAANGLTPETSSREVPFTSIPQSGETVNAPRPTAYQSPDMSAQGKRARARAVYETGTACGVDPAILDTAAKLAENTGRRIEFVETLGGIDGMYDASTGTLTVAADTPYPIRAILKHELTHSLEGTKAYAELSDFVLREFIETDAVKSGLSLDAVVDAKIAQYADAGKTLSRDDAMRELVADYCASKLFTNDAAIRRLSAGKPGVARRILNWIRSMKTKIAGTAEEKTLARAEELYHEALMEPFSKGEGILYSIGYTTDNRPVVVVEEDILKDIPRAEWVKKVKETISRKFSGGIPVGGRLVKVNRISKNEYINSRYSQGIKSNDGSVYRDKLKTANNLDEIVLSSTNYINEDLKHERKDNFKEFARGDVLIRVGGKDYTAKVIIGFTTGNQMVLYDVIDFTPAKFELKKGDTQYRYAQSAGSDRKRVSPYDPTVPQSTDGVNTSISKNTGDDTQAALGYMGEDTAAALKQMVEKYGKRADNPVEIGRLTPQDADTTPPVAGGQRDTGNGYTVPAEPAPRGNSESHFTENVGNSSIFDDRFKKLSLEDAGIHTYDSITNKETLNAANKKLNDGGYRAVSDWFAKPVSQATPEDIATGIILLSRYQLAGDYEGMVNAARRLRKMGTAAGQTVQEFAILSRMTPEGMAYYAQKSLDEAFETMVKNRSQSWVDKNADKYRLTDEDIRFIMDKTAKASKLPAGRDKNILLGEIAGRIQDKIPPEKGQNIRALARISMLLNPKTNVRNVLGNASITPVSWLDDLIGTAVDKAVARKTGQRTTGLFDLKSFKGLGKGVYESFDDFRRGINTRDIDADRFEIGRGGKSFNEHHSGAAGVLNPMSKALNALDRTTSFLLEAGDRGFFEMWFMNSLKNQMKLNGVKTPTAEMVEVARQDALSRTWQDTNGYTKFVSGVKKALNSVQVGGYGLGDVFIKFTKTPANLTKALVDYSPVGLTKAIAADGRRFYQAATRGEATPQLQRRFVNSLSKGITGTLLMLLFAALANRDILQGKGDADSDVAEFEKNILGIQPYSVKIGDKSYSYEWMQPIGGSAAIVADIVGQMKGEKPKQYFKGGTQAEEAANAILSAIQSGGQVLYDQSFMQSLANLFEADSLVQGLLDGILAEPSVFVPQIVSQTSQLFDDTARRSYVSGRPLETAENKILARTPWRTQLEPVVDTLGREVAGNNNVWDAYFNPANTYTANPTPAAEEMYRVYQKTGDKRVIPPKAPNSISVSVDGGQQTVSLTAEQKTAYQKTTGSIASREVSHLLRSSQYRKLSETEKADVLADIYTYANAVAKSEVSEYALTGANAKIAQAENAGISVADYLIFSLSKDADGNRTVSQKEMRQALDASDFTTGQKSVLWQLQNAGWKTNPYNSAYLETDIDKLLKGALS